MIEFLFDFSAKQCGKSDSLSIDELCSLVRNRLRESSAVRFVSAILLLHCDVPATLSAFATIHFYSSGVVLPCAYATAAR